MIGFLAMAAAAAVVVPEGAALTDAIRARDAELFGLMFDGCDPARLRTMLTDDFEMYHDKGGVVARDADAMIADYAKSCTARQAPDAWRSRRELQAETLNVHPVPGHGAIEDGWHLFHERKGDGPEKLVGRARFTILWRLDPDGWRMARVLSYAHAPAGEGAAPAGEGPD